MIHQIITSTDKQNTQNKLRRTAINYNIAYCAVVVFSLCVVLLPFRFNWIKSANTEPREAVVHIEANEGIGTGFLISPYYILTARHVVEGVNIGDYVNISFSQAKNPIETTAQIAHYNSFNFNNLNEQSSLTDILSYFESDVALLRLDEEIKQITPLKLGNSDEFKTGQVLLMGYGMDDWSEPDGKITSNSFHELKTLYKLDGASNKGHSGGPVMALNNNNEPTEVIGIIVGDCSMVFSQQYGSIVSGEKMVLKINQADKILSASGYNIRNNQN